MSQPSLSLVVCTYRRPDDVRTLLEALRAQTDPPDEIVVVDGSPDDATEEAIRAGGYLREEASEYHRVPPEQRGLTRQRNVGVERTEGELVAFLDDDTVPAPEYFAEVRACFRRHPEAVGVGGYITNLVEWTPVEARRGRPPLRVYRAGSWERREDVRWRLRRLLGLDSPAPPGRMPPSGHGRSVGFLPPDGEDHEVDFVVGAAMTWRRDVLERESYSDYFEGYGLYEDLEFCIRAGRHGELYMCGAARVEHFHAAGGRPDAFRYGIMVVRNGWYVWRTRWPRPGWGDRLKWWATTVLLTGGVAADVLRFRRPLRSLLQAAGRTWGMMSLLVTPPRVSPGG